jgi:4-amino-4-deoxy-L-arabinose transferase-like glycosyltransferase
MVKKIIIIISIIFSLGFMFRNAYHYPVNAGYDAWLHLRYANIVSHQWRIPTFQESRENYNPPLFYLISGLTGRIAQKITNQEYFSAIKAWQYLSIFLATTSLYLWHLIVKKLHPKNKFLQAGFLVLLFSVPVFHKTIVMFSIETWFLFTTSLTFWFLINRFIDKVNLKNTIILSLLLAINFLTRMTAIILLATVLVAFLGLVIKKKISLKKTVALVSLMLVIILSSSSWFYFGRNSQEVYGVGEGGELTTPFFKRQPVSFYLDVPFKFMMTHPIRLSDPLNKLIPIYYSEFWGDFWNYYSQRRFGISVQARKKDHYVTSEKRVSNLALQNQVNLPATLLIVSGFIYLILKNKKKINLPESLFLTFTLLTWLGFLALLTKYPSWKGDSIKASYMLYNLPIFIYALAVFVFKPLRTYKAVFIPVIIYLASSTVINLIWSWY